MAAPTDCALCGRLLPLGGVVDDVGRPVHLFCRELRKLEIAELARATAQRVKREGKPSGPLLQEVAAMADCAIAAP